MRNRILNGDYKAIALFILVILFIFGCSSCMTNRKGQLTEKGKNFIALHCKGSDSTVTIEKEIRKDTTIYITQMSEPVYIDSPCKDLCDSLGRLKPVNIVKKDHGVVKKITSHGSALEFDCDVDSLKAVISTLQKEKSVISKEKTVIQKPCDLDHITGTQWYWIRSGQFLLAFIALQILIRILSTYLPFLRVLYVFKF